MPHKLPKLLFFDELWHNLGFLHELDHLRQRNSLIYVFGTVKGIVIRKLLHSVNALIRVLLKGLSQEFLLLLDQAVQRTQLAVFEVRGRRVDDQS